MDRMALRKARVELDVTQSQLAKILGLSSHSVVSNWESERYQPGPAHCLLIELALKFPEVRKYLKTKGGIATKGTKRESFRPTPAPAAPSAASPGGEFADPYQAKKGRQIWAYLQEKGSASIRNILNDCQCNIYDIEDNLKIWMEKGLAEFSEPELRLMHMGKGEVRLLAQGEG